MKYQPPFDPSFNGPVNGIYNASPTAPYVNGNPATGQEGSIPPFESVVHSMKEIVHVIEWSGQTPDHADLEQLRKALKWLTGDRLIDSIGGGIPIYVGLNDVDTHEFRSLEAGANITLALVESPPGSGKHRIRISAAGGGGGGGGEGGGNPLLNVGGGAEVYKGFNDPNDELRTFVGKNGTKVTQQTNTIEIDTDTINRCAVYNVPGNFTFTVPAGVTRLRVTVEGGGGGGCAHQNAPIQAQNGGTSSFGAHVSATGGDGGYYYHFQPQPGGGVGGTKNWNGRGGRGGVGNLAYDGSAPGAGVVNGAKGGDGGRAMKWIDVTPGDAISLTVGIAGAGAISDTPPFLWHGVFYNFDGMPGEPGLVLVEW